MARNDANASFSLCKFPFCLCELIQVRKHIAMRMHSTHNIHNIHSLFRIGIPSSSRIYVETFIGIDSLIFRKRMHKRVGYAEDNEKLYLTEQSSVPFQEKCNRISAACHLISCIPFLHPMNLCIKKYSQSKLSLSEKGMELMHYQRRPFKPIMILNVYYLSQQTLRLSSDGMLSEPIRIE